MNLLDTVATNTFTISDLKRRVRVLKEYLEKKIFGGNLKIELVSQDSLWLNSLTNIGTVVDTKNFYQQMADLAKAVSALSPLIIYLAFDPPDEVISKLALDLRKILNSNLIFLDIKKDPGLLGGSAFVYKGIYKDYSLRAKLEQNKEKILLEIKRGIA